MKPLIFKLTQTERNGYDTFDSVIVIAWTAKTAQTWHPGLKKFIKEFDEEFASGEWASCADNVSVELIGEALSEDVILGEVLASFNAG